MRLWRGVVFMIVHHRITVRLTVGGQCQLAEADGRQQHEGEREGKLCDPAQLHGWIIHDWRKPRLLTYPRNYHVA